MQFSEGWIFYFLISYIFLFIITVTNLLYLYRWYKHDKISWENIPTATRHFLFTNTLVNILLIFYVVNAHGIFNLFTLPEPYGKYFFGCFLDFTANLILLGFLSYVSRLLHVSLYNFSGDEELSLKANIWLTLLNIYGFIAEKIVLPSVLIFLFISFDQNSYVYMQYTFFVSGLILFISGISYLSFIVITYFAHEQSKMPAKKLVKLTRPSVLEISPTNSDYTSILLINDHTSSYAPLPSWAVIPSTTIESAPSMERIQKNCRSTQNQKIISAWIGIVLTFVTTGICFYKGIEVRNISDGSETIEQQLQVSPSNYPIGLDLFSYMRCGFIIIAQQILTVPPAVTSCK